MRAKNVSERLHMSSRTTTLLRCERHTARGRGKHRPPYSSVGAAAAAVPEVTPSWAAGAEVAASAHLLVQQPGHDGEGEDAGAGQNVGKVRVRVVGVALVLQLQPRGACAPAELHATDV